MNILETIQNLLTSITGVLSPALVILSFATIIIKPMRNLVVMWIQKQTHSTDVIDRLDTIDGTIKDVQSQVESVETKLVAHAEENSRDIKASNEAQKMSLRGQIRDIYRRNLPYKSLSLIEHRDIYDLYEVYTKLNGNGYVKGLITEMSTWSVNAGIGGDHFNDEPGASRPRVL